MSKYESTIRMEPDLANRLDVIAQVVGLSKNQLIVNAVRGTILDYEDDPEYRTKRQEWLQQLTQAASA